MANRLSIIELLLKFINFIFILSGGAVGAYGMYCLMEWTKDSNHSHRKYEIFRARALLAIHASNWLSNKFPWFGCFLLIIAASLIVISCFGFVGAATRSWSCLCFYSVLLVGLFVAQLGAAAFMLFNHNWKEDIPNDSSGRLASTYNFLTENWKIIRLVILGAIALEVIALALALCLCLKSEHRGVYNSNNYERVVHPKIVRRNIDRKSKPADLAAPSASFQQQTISRV